MNGSDPPAEASPVRRAGFLTRCVATGFFTGYIPWASGTFGTLAGLLFLLLPGVHQTFVLLPLIVCVFPLGVITAGKVAAAEGDRLSRAAAAAKAVFQPGTREHPDPSIVVIDEIIGIWITLLLIPPSVPAYVAGFVFFRLFDVIKPQPARRMEHIRGGWGIMLDDVVAGVYANIATRLLLLAIAYMYGS
jgi:phosphatidylglycerophosphatase A